MSRQLSTIAAHGTYGTPGARNPAGGSSPARPGATAADSDHSGGSTAPHPDTTGIAQRKADEMDAMLAEL